ncbi:MAG: ornithine carbamoyltransferase [Candidatus Undinarchaeales archaeon]|jgi:ornithine carbamoyltransferase|nr:ornithine carbamoyltransferase [Candidatus Undinarchaeales archaeon]MDP7491781.1 ornithine carbamoyltransferase [Candidatus Undinarchaeales archaeon]
MSSKLGIKDLTSIEDLTTEQVWKIFRLAENIKLETFAGKRHHFLEGQTLGMLFQKPSTRTRISFEVGMTQLGGHAIYLGWNDVQLGRGETVPDFARVVSRYLDGIMARVFAHEHIIQLAEASRVPVINGLSDLLHPCQGLTDLFTMWEKLGSLDGKKLVFVGDGDNNVTHSLLNACTKLGVDIAVGCPKGFEPRNEFVSRASEAVNVTITNDPDEAVAGADAIYTDVWVSMGKDEERAKRLKAFAPYQVNAALVAKAKKGAIVMHCLPAHREEELTSEVMDSPISVVVDQAENRLHVQKAVMALLMGR